jgi:hypothetical protein
VIGIGWESAFTSLSTMPSKVVAGFAHAKGTKCAMIIITLQRIMRHLLIY